MPTTLSRAPLISVTVFEVELATVVPPQDRSLLTVRPPPSTRISPANVFAEPDKETAPAPVIVSATFEPGAA